MIKLFCNCRRRGTGLENYSLGLLPEDVMRS